MGSALDRLESFGNGVIQVFLDVFEVLLIYMLQIYMMVNFEQPCLELAWLDEDKKMVENNWVVSLQVYVLVVTQALL